ncbi:hypothetical protein NY2A_b787R [Paramecium bursaria Chlorella virus NY2A]|uniref:Uncharacterized protein b787R n=1 Tax=Paramecium bursaria Chlorella virus NY2A TaxID=46021 RepID=A7IXW2_PBCVN|nr:hypothetical protein NY2A_b787R [Paramecium bursaria Chlorella virus NY2A]YP_001498792.1 hypothetical protein AR158_C711R [Paramecium bursaria Chlorella virus AR158]ABT15186.1 hypothetical protein NY2A_b787R [Paramecium bursaria Chlorella virus NY2A]ABU44256.1 hypothetical protein AR158_C711R [Paramecium bursaria Chlorella virus AR158]
MLATDASRTFNSFPRRGNTPYLSRPTTDSPAIASVAAESPSVRMRVHILLLFVPAHVASLSLGIPVTRIFLVPSVFFSSF